MVHTLRCLRGFSTPASLLLGELLVLTAVCPEHLPTWPAPGCCWGHHNHSALRAHPCSSQSDGGFHAPTPGPGSHPSFPLSHAVLAAESGFGLTCLDARLTLLPACPCALRAPWALAPGLEIFHVSLESPEDHRHAPGSSHFPGHITGH